MRIWHEELIPFLCRKHLLAQWREGLGCFNIILFNKKGYSRHPQLLMYKEDILSLFLVLMKTKNEMRRRDYKPKKILKDQQICDAFLGLRGCQHGKARIAEWQSLEEQKKILRKKGCDCNV